MSLYQNSVTVGGLVNLPVFSNDALVPVFYGGVTYKVTMGDILSKVTKATIGLPNVNNTSDLEKPISVATQTALDGKADTVHTHNLTQIAGLNAALSLKADTGHTHSTADVTGLDAALSGKADSVHSHQLADVAGLTGILSGKADTATVTAQLLTKTDVGHTHAATDIIGLPSIPADLATETFVINAIASEPVHAHIHNLNDVTGLVGELASKASVSHGHGISSITGLQTALDSKAAQSHMHGIAGVTGLQTVLDNKTDAGHPHVVGSIMDFNDGVKAVVAGYLKAGSNITLGVDANELTVSSTASGGGAAAVTNNSVKIFEIESTSNFYPGDRGQNAVLLNEIAVGEDSVDFDAYMGTLEFNIPGFYRIHIRTVASLLDVNMQPQNAYDFPSSVVHGTTVESSNFLSISGQTEQLTTSSVTLNHARPTFQTWDREFYADAPQPGGQMRIYTKYCLANTDNSIDASEWTMKHKSVIFVERLTTKTPDTVHVFNLSYTDGAYINPNNKIDAWVLTSSFGKTPAKISYNDGTNGTGFARFIVDEEGVYRIIVQASVRRSGLSESVSEPASENLSCEFGTNVISRNLATMLVQSNLKSSTSITLDQSTDTICAWTHETYALVRTPGAGISVAAWFNSHFADVVLIEEWRLDYNVTVTFERIMPSSSVPFAA
jgi:hypothetical protein